MQLEHDDLPPYEEPPAAAPSDALSDPFATTVTSTGGESDGSRGDGGDGSARGSSGGGGAVLAPFSAVALSARVVQRLQKAVAASTSSSDVGLAAALRLLVRKSPDLECGVVRRAFAYWNRSCRWNVVAAMDDQNVAKAAAAAAAGGRAAGAAAAALEAGTMAVAAQRRSTLPARTVAPTLIAFCAAGVTDKTVGALLSLESGVGDPHRCALPTPQTQVAADPSQRGSHHAADPLTCASFDVVVGVSPFPGDRTAEFLEAGGVAVLRQPAPLGLSDLWNRLVRYAFLEQPPPPPPQHQQRQTLRQRQHHQHQPKAYRYEYLLISNNDVLVAPGSVGAVAAYLSHNPSRIATVLTQKGGGLESLGDRVLGKAGPELVAFAEHPMNYRAVQAALVRSGIHHRRRTAATKESPPEQLSALERLRRERGRKEPTFGADEATAEQRLRFIDRRTMVGFFWGVSRSLAKGLLVPDGSGRLFNTTARLNFGQEAELVDRMPKTGYTGCRLRLLTYLLTYLYPTP